MSTAAYRDVENLSARAIGELFDGQLHAQSRPAFPHAYAHSYLEPNMGRPEDYREPVTRIERLIVNPPAPVDERTGLLK